MSEAKPREMAGPEIIVANQNSPSRFSGEISVSDKAAEKLKAILEAEKKDPTVYGLRLGVKGGGCSGMSYVMEFDTAHDDDKVFVHPTIPARVMVDTTSSLHLSGSVLDYDESLMKSGFSIKNPNVKSSCGCGESFSTQ